jgi:hypothetical protein
VCRDYRRTLAYTTQPIEQVATTGHRATAGDEHHDEHAFIIEYSIYV